jgi:hypothetical protein
MSGASIARRSFLGSVGLMAGAVVATTLVPLSAVHALPSDLALMPAEPNGFGSVDDACGHWPPYSHPIPYGQVPAAPSVFAQAEPVDHIFLV